jgi:diphthine-ammonia ligase
VTLLLSDMAHFPAANTAYGALFGSSPPARACVAADLPAPARVRLEVLACADHELAEPSARRQALHVQGLSYWAPANIGPYSQAVRVRRPPSTPSLRILCSLVLQVVERAFISGQIGLIPSSMALPEPRKLATETALCFQHTHRIADALRASTGGGAWAGCAQLALYWLARPEDIAPVRVACLAAEVSASHPFPCPAPMLTLAHRRTTCRRCSWP